MKTNLCLLNKIMLEIHLSVFIDEKVDKYFICMFVVDIKFHPYFSYFRIFITYLLHVDVMFIPMMLPCVQMFLLYLMKAWFKFIRMQLLTLQY